MVCKDKTRGKLWAFPYRVEKKRVFGGERVANDRK